MSFSLKKIGLNVKSIYIKSGRIMPNIGWLSFERVLRLSLGLMVWSLLAAHLDPAQFGVLNYSIAYIAVFSVLATLGLNGILVRDLVRDPGSSQEILGTSFILRLLGAIATIGCLWLVIVKLRPDDYLTQQIVYILSFSLIFKSSEVIKCWYESQVISKYWVWAQISVFLTMVVVKLLMIVSNATLEMFALAITIESGILAISVSFVYFRKHSQLRFWGVSLVRAKKLISDSWPLIISSGAIILYMKIDMIMIGEMLTVKDVGIYSVASRISEAWYFIPVIINTSLRPMLIKLKAQSSSLFIARLQYSFSLMIWLSISVSFLVSFFSEDIVLFFFGQEYLEAAEVLVIHIWASVFVFLNNAIWTWYYAEEKQKTANYRLIVGLLLNVLLNYLLIPIMGILGAAWATLISRAFVAYFGQLMSRDTVILFHLINRAIIFKK